MRRVTSLAVIFIMLLFGAISPAFAIERYYSAWQSVTGLPTTAHVNVNGQVTGSITSPSGTISGFVWTPFSGEFSYIGGSGYRVALGVNDAGDVVGRDSRGPMIWSRLSLTSPGSVLPGVSPPYPGGKSVAGGTAYSSNNNSQIVGSAPCGTGYWNVAEHAAIWNKDIDGKWQSALRFSVPNGEKTSAAYEINDAGQAVGWYSDDSGREHALFWNSVNGVKELSEFRNCTGSRALAINSRGEAVGSAMLGGVQRAVHWLADGRLVELMRPGSRGQASAEDISDSGLIVGNTSAGATIWDLDGTAYALPIPEGMTYSRAFGIGESGLIVGMVGDNSGQCRINTWVPGWGIYPTQLFPQPVVPEPGTFVATGLFYLAMFGGMRMRRKS